MKPAKVYVLIVKRNLLAMFNFLIYVARENTFPKWDLLNMVSTSFAFVS